MWSHFGVYLQAGYWSISSLEVRWPFEDQDVCNGFQNQKYIGVLSSLNGLYLDNNPKDYLKYKSSKRFIFYVLNKVSIYECFLELAIFFLPMMKEHSDKWSVPWVNIRKRPIFLKPRRSKCEPFNSRKHGSTVAPQLIVKRTLDATTGSLGQRGEHLHSGLLICSQILHKLLEMC